MKRINLAISAIALLVFGLGLRIDNEAFKIPKAQAQQTCWYTDESLRQDFSYEVPYGDCYQKTNGGPEEWVGTLVYCNYGGTETCYTYLCTPSDPIHQECIAYYY